MNYQFIEESLRFCLIRCHATIKFRLEGYLGYEVPYKAIGDAALGRLIEWYRPYTENQTLIEELRKIKSARDQTAHESLLSLSEHHEEGILAKTTALEASHAEARACFLRLVDEMHRTDRAVNRAYENLRATYAARRMDLPESLNGGPPPSPGQGVPEV